MSRVNELALAAIDACNASCKKHRTRAMIRLRKAAEALGPLEESQREGLIRDLVSFVHDWEGDDPKADALLERCQNMGWL